jgi:drug/metabolite transporter (DMT)-like permease
MNTFIIAEVLGIFFVVFGVAMVVNGKGVASAIEATAQDRGTLFVWGLLALLVGAVIVALNNIWSGGLPLLVTVLGWIALLKGVYILICPGSAASLYRKFNKHGVLVFCGVVAVVIGLILLYW